MLHYSITPSAPTTAGPVVAIIPPNVARTLFLVVEDALLETPGTWQERIAELEEAKESLARAIGAKEG